MTTYGLGTSDRQKATGIALKSLGRIWTLTDKLSSPPRRRSTTAAVETLWPTTLDGEAYKAARILRSFCSEC